ncbi:hypothetical protein GCM10010272_29070 [Streptomyces lateritius]|nr:hypothetical protein GCM10010272_29070 [Streptomyces lateritius]
MSRPPAFTGTPATDALASCTVYGDSQALCGAHVLRELIAVNEDTRRDATWGRSRDRRADRGEDGCRRRGGRRPERTGPATLTAFRDRHQHAALCGISANPYSGSGAKSKARAPAERMRDRTAEYTSMPAGMVSVIIRRVHRLAFRAFKVIRAWMKGVNVRARFRT